MEVMKPSQDPIWICASCGARHRTNEKPCRECASERFARLEEPDEKRFEQSVDVTWVCDGCGRETPRNNTQCRNCGSFSYTRVDNTTSIDAVTQSEQQTTPKSTRDTHYYIGIVVAAACAIVFPYFLIFLAIPEAIMAHWDRSIQDSLNEGAQTNPFISGSFLVIRLFGNFALLVLLLLFLVGFYLGLS